MISVVEERFSGGLVSVAEKIRSILDVTDDEAFLAIATEDLRTEFNGQINSALHDDAGKICLTIKQHATSFSLRGCVNPLIASSSARGRILGS